jgi:hypothetical protein
MRKRGRYLSFLFLLSAFIAPQLLAGTVYYVATNGNDTYNGLYPSYQSGSNGPFRTLNRASSAAAPGDIVQVRGGTYVQKVYWTKSGTATNRITITNYPNESPIIDGEYTLPGGSVYYFLVEIQASYATISNITIKRSAGGLLALDGNSAAPKTCGDREPRNGHGGRWSRLHVRRLHHDGQRQRVRH